MACCGGKRRKKSPQTRDRYDVLGGYGTLPQHQIRARLEVFKRRYCADCERRYECDYKTYEECQKYKIGGR